MKTDVTPERNDLGIVLKEETSTNSNKDEEEETDTEEEINEVEDTDDERTDSNEDSNEDSDEDSDEDTDEESEEKETDEETKNEIDSETKTDEEGKSNIEKLSESEGSYKEVTDNERAFDSDPINSSDGESVNSDENDQDGSETDYEEDSDSSADLDNEKAEVSEAFKKLTQQYADGNVDTFLLIEFQYKFNKKQNKKLARMQKKYVERDFVQPSITKHESDDNKSENDNIEEPEIDNSMGNKVHEFEEDSDEEEVINE